MYQQNESNNYNMNQNPNLNEQNQNMHAPNTQPADPAAQTGTMPNQNTNAYQPPVDGVYHSGPYTAKPSSGPSNNPQNPVNPQQPPKKQKSGAGAKVGLIVACMVLSLACGFGGAVAANVVTGSGNGSSNASTTVLYQSVENQTDPATTTVADVAAAVQDTVVAITTETVATDSYFGQYVTSGAGSGVIISEDGYIVTNNHVVDGATDIKVTLSNGDEYQATLIGIDPTNDIGVIKIDAKDLNAATMGNSDELVVGEDVIAIGNPLGTLSGTVTNGIISALDRQISIDGETYHLLQTNAAINPGNSGGGLFNAKGELIGIVNAKSSSSSSETSIEGLGFAIPIDTVKPLVSDLIEYGYVTGRVQLGVSLVAITDERTAAQYRVSELGVYIAQVTDGSDAANAGLQAGDLIQSVNGTEIESVDDVANIVDDSSVGDTLEIVILRDGKQQTVSVTLTEYHTGSTLLNS